MYHPLLASFSVNGDYDSPREGGRLGDGFVHAVLRKGSVFTTEAVLWFVDQTVSKSRGLGYVLDRGTAAR